MTVSLYLSLSALMRKFVECFPMIGSERDENISVRTDCARFAGTIKRIQLRKALQDKLAADITRTTRRHQVRQRGNGLANVSELFEAHIQTTRQLAIIFILSKPDVMSHDLAAKHTSNRIKNRAFVRQDDVDCSRSFTIEAVNMQIVSTQHRNKAITTSEHGDPLQESGSDTSASIRGSTNIALQQHRSNRIDRQAFYELLQYRIGTKTLFTSSDKLIDTSHIDLFRLTQHHQSVGCSDKYGARRLGPERISLVADRIQSMCEFINHFEGNLLSHRITANEMLIRCSQRVPPFTLKDMSEVNDVDYIFTFGITGCVIMNLALRIHRNKRFT